MASIRKYCTIFFMFLSVIIIISYWLIFESKFYNDLLSEYSLNLPTIRIQHDNSALQHYTLSSNSSENYALNHVLYGLSSLERSAIRSSQWINPSIITPFTIVIGFCCELDKRFDCELQEFVLILSMAIWNNSTHNIYFQRCLKTGLPPTHFTQITIKQRRDPSLNNNNTKQWIIHDDNRTMWFQPDMYLCQGYFWDKELIDTRVNATNIIIVKHEEEVDLLQYDIAVGRKKKIPSHRLVTYRPLLLTSNTEFWGGGNCKRYDILFDTVIGRSATGCMTIHAPPAFWYEFMRIKNNTTQLIVPHTDDAKKEYLQHILSMKNKDMFHTLFLVKYCYVKERYNADVLIRVLFFDKLKARYSAMNGTNPGIDSLSRCRRDKSAMTKLGDDYIPRGQDKTFGYQGVRDGAVEMALKYKFMITMENSRTRGYLTEKLFNGLYGYTVPIYFGDDMVNIYFNDKRFINCNISDENASRISLLTHQNKKMGVNNDEEMLLKQVGEIIGKRLDECVDRVIEIDQDDDKYKEMLLQPIFKDNKYVGSILDPFVMADKVKKVLKILDSYLLDDD